MVIVIVGPTAVGKTKMSIELAKRLNGEIINADSTQIYEGMDIATAKVTETEMEDIPHHLLSICPISKEYTVYDYQKDCRQAIQDILERGKQPILVGGTGLYIKAALYDYQFEEQKEKKDYCEYSDDVLYQKLKELDPDTMIHQNNRKRIESALQYCEETGKPYSQKEKTNTLLYDAVFIGLTTERALLYDRIDRRVDVMVKQGLLREAQYYFENARSAKAVLTPIGYKELFSYFEQKESLEICLEKIKQQSRRYAKRQYTWFYHQMPVHWFSVDFECFENTVQDVEKFLKDIDSHI